MTETNFEEEWDKFKQFCIKNNHVVKVPGAYAFMNPKTGNVLKMLKDHKAKLIKKNDVEDVEFEECCENDKEINNGDIDELV